MYFLAQLNCRVDHRFDYVDYADVNGKQGAGLWYEELLFKKVNVDC